ncbi:MAG: pantetheine-phosphate adenylyltransferase [Thermoplasmata archaeon]|nr:pantetheine-phosphate adenylyltransferase [Thermoplasmata archaeon]
MRRRTAVLGGTFDRLHLGHEALLREAFRSAPDVAIGVTTDRYLAEHPKPDGEKIAPFRVRRARLAAYLRRQYGASSWRIVPLSDPFGRSVEPGVDILVASEETRRGALAVNRMRRKRGLRPLTLRLVPLVRGTDGLPVSSRRVRAGRIDSRGRHRGPLVVAWDSSSGHAGTVSRAFAAEFPELHVSLSQFRWRDSPNAGGSSPLPRLPPRAEYGVRVRRAGAGSPDAARGELLLTAPDARVLRRTFPAPVSPAAYSLSVSRELRKLLRRARRDSSL